MWWILEPYVALMTSVGSLDLLFNFKCYNQLCKNTIFNFLYKLHTHTSDIIINNNIFYFEIKKKVT